MDTRHLLIVEDEEEIALILRDYLLREGYRVSLLTEGGGVIDFVRRQSPALVLLDIMIPKVDGKTLCREIREFSDIPVIMITAKVEEIDRIIGFELGADDYICKPFSPREVVARVNAVLRRTLIKRPEETVSAGPVQLNRSSRQAAVKGTELHLTPSEFEILWVLAETPNRVFTRAQLIDRVQGYSYEGYERTVDFHIKNLRKKIKCCLPGNTPIQSAYGMGYKLVV